MKTTKISADLGDPKLLMLLRQEAALTDQSIKEVLVHALESYFANRLETKAVMKLGEEVFAEWNNPLDAEYDKL